MREETRSVETQWSEGTGNGQSTNLLHRHPWTTPDGPDPAPGTRSIVVNKMVLACMVLSLAPGGRQTRRQATLTLCDLGCDGERGGGALRPDLEGRRLLEETNT